jgi:hypothetical protein
MPPPPFAFAIDPNVQNVAYRVNRYRPLRVYSVSLIDGEQTFVGEINVQYEPGEFVIINRICIVNYYCNIVYRM